MLYLIVLGLMLRMTLDRSYRIQLPGVPILFGILIGYAVLTYLAIVLVIDYPRYDPLFTGFQLKNRWSTCCCSSSCSSMACARTKMR